MLVQSGHDLLEDRETDLLAVEVEPRPVAHEGHGSPRRITSGRRSALAVGGDELVDRARREAVPAAEPVARAADDRHDTTRVVALGDEERQLDPSAHPARSSVNWWRTSGELGRRASRTGCKVAYAMQGQHENVGRSRARGSSSPGGLGNDSS